MSPSDWNFLPLQNIPLNAPESRKPGRSGGREIGNGDVAVPVGTHHYLPEAFRYYVWSGEIRWELWREEKEKEKKEAGGGRDFLAGIIENRSDSCTV